MLRNTPEAFPAEVPEAFRTAPAALWKALPGKNHHRPSLRKKHCNRFLRKCLPTVWYNSVPAPGKAVRLPVRRRCRPGRAILSPKGAGCVPKPEVLPDRPPDPLPAGGGGVVSFQDTVQAGRSTGAGVKIFSCCSPPQKQSEEPLPEAMPGFHAFWIRPD